MDKIERLKQLLLTHRTENINKLTFEQRIDFDDVFAQEIVKLFAIHVVNQQRELLDWLSNEPDHNIRKSDIEEILQDFKYYQSNCG
jgi:hypothetical protein